MQADFLRTRQNPDLSDCEKENDKLIALPLRNIARAVKEFTGGPRDKGPTIEDIQGDKYILRTECLPALNHYISLSDTQAIL